jgi:hypothetical protein
MNWISAAIAYRIVRGPEHKEQQYRGPDTRSTVLFSGFMTGAVLMLPIILFVTSGLYVLAIAMIPSLVVVVFFTVDSLPGKNHGKQSKN